MAGNLWHDLRAMKNTASASPGRLMKSHLTPFFLFVALAFPHTPAVAQGAVQPPLISVTGSAEVKVAPDEIYLRVGVETRNESLDAAKKENDDRVSKTLVFLKSSSVSEKDVQTDFISVDPSYSCHIREFSVVFLCQHWRKVRER